LRLEPYWLLLLAPSLLFTEQLWEPVLRPFFILALFLFWPLRLKVGIRALPAGATGWFTGFLLLWIPVTIWRAPDSEVAWASAGYLYFALAFFLALIHWRLLQKKPVRLALLLLSLGTTLAVIGPDSFSVDPDKQLNFYLVSNFDEPNLMVGDTPPQPAQGSNIGDSDTLSYQQVRDFSSTVDSDHTSTFGLQQWFGQETINPNILAAFLALLLPLGLALALRWPWRNQGWRWLLLWPSLLLMGNALLLSQSRGAWIATLVALFLLASLQLGKRRRWQIVGIVLFGSGVLVTLIPLTLARTNPLLWRFLIDLPVVESAWLSLLRRLGIWQLSLQLVLQNPLLGVGLGMYEQAFRDAFPALPLINGRSVPPHAHNLFVQLALDLGLPGLLAYVGLLGTLVRSLLGVLQQKIRDRTSTRLIIGLIGTLTAMMTVGLVDNALWGTKLVFLPWSLFALVWLVTHAGSENERYAR